MATNDPSTIFTMARKKKDFRNLESPFSPQPDDNSHSLLVEDEEREDGKEEREAAEEEIKSAEEEREAAEEEREAAEEERENTEEEIEGGQVENEEKEDGENGTALSWPKVEDLELFNRIRIACPKDDVMKYDSRVKHLNWEFIKFHGYSATQCKNRWLYVQSQLRHYRILDEILLDASSWIDRPDRPNFNKGRNTKHPELPKPNNLYSKSTESARVVPPKPPTPFQIFSGEKMKEYIQRGASATEARLQCRGDYKVMKSKRKLVWINKAKEREPIYKEELDKFKANHPDVDVAKKSSLLTKEELQIKQKYEGKPDKPPNSGYNLFSKKLLSGKSLKHVEPKYRMAKIGSLWKELSDEERASHNEKAKQMKHIYEIKYANYFETLTPEQRKAELVASAVKYMKKTVGKTTDKKPIVCDDGSSSETGEEEDFSDPPKSTINGSSSSLEEQFYSGGESEDTLYHDFDNSVF